MPGGQHRETADEPVEPACSRQAVVGGVVAEDEEAANGERREQ